MVRRDGRASDDEEECRHQRKNHKRDNNDRYLSDETLIWYKDAFRSSPVSFYNYEFKINVKSLQFRALHLHLNVHIIIES